MVHSRAPQMRTRTWVGGREGRGLSARCGVRMACTGVRRGALSWGEGEGLVGLAHKVLQTLDST